MEEVRHLRNGSKEAFYKWIDDVKKAFRHKTELEEKLKYYERRLVGYNAVTYDSISSGSRKNNVEENLLYVIGKIDQIKLRYEKSDQLIKQYHDFNAILNNQEVDVLEYLEKSSLSKYQIAIRMAISKTRVYSIILVIIAKYSKYMGLK